MPRNPRHLGLEFQIASIESGDDDIQYVVHHGDGFGVLTEEFLWRWVHRN